MSEKKAYDKKFRDPRTNAMELMIEMAERHRQASLNYGLGAGSPPILPLGTGLPCLNSVLPIWALTKPKHRQVKDIDWEKAFRLNPKLIERM